jgi:hypothetical protein
MPPESLSTFAVMNPGPSTARKRMIRIRQRFHMVTRVPRVGSLRFWIYVKIFLTDHNRAGAEARRATAQLDFFAQKADDPLCLNHANHAALRVNDGKRVKIVFVEHFGQIILFQIQRG